MNIFKEASISKAKGTGYKANRRFKIWESSKCTWQHFMINYGIRWSDRWQIFPIWNSSHNQKRGLVFGFWKLYFELEYAKGGSFNQDRWLPKNRFFRRLYQLFS